MKTIKAQIVDLKLKRSLYHDKMINNFDNLTKKQRVNIRIEIDLINEEIENLKQCKGE